MTLVIVQSEKTAVLRSAVSSILPAEAGHEWVNRLLDEAAAGGSELTLPNGRKVMPVKIEGFEVAYHDNGATTIAICEPEIRTVIGSNEFSPAFAIINAIAAATAEQRALAKQAGIFAPGNA
jgi:hypothetical protein